ncbi:hypothetical protein GY45DRAFT_1316540 [Cubamyces sp. BRFM 1775]|nr:hypothetical protein GY45DRAFT_1316540 [Cubamyces sp. BRFM 1775]
MAIETTRPRVHVREGTEADLAQIVPLYIASLATIFPETNLSAEPGYAPHRVRRVLRSRLFAPPPRLMRTYVVEVISTGEIVAFAHIVSKWDPEVASALRARQPGISERELDRKLENDLDELDMFYVKVGAWGRGYGMLLMETIKYVWCEDSPAVKLLVYERNERAIRFYERHGFRRAAGRDVLIRSLLQLTEPRDDVFHLMCWRIMDEIIGDRA